MSGAQLVTGFALMIPGVAFAVASQTETDAVPPTSEPERILRIVSAEPDRLVVAKG